MILAALGLAGFNTHGADGRVHLRTQGSNALLQVQGDRDDDWRIQVSTNLTHWFTLTNFGTLLSGRITNAPSRVVGAASNSLQFYRALKTDGLYDRTLFRTVNLTFTQTNWPTLLMNGRNTGSNTPCTVFWDNGATNFGVGARYKGNSSYFIGGTKKSINLEFDFIDTNANLMTYQTVNLNNAAMDETIMREALYFNGMHDYTPCPQGAMARVFINSRFWGVYSLVQQENTQLIKEWFPSVNGDRWRTPNAGDSGFTYLGTNISVYMNRYDLRTDNSSNAWQRLVNAITVLNTTPADQFRDRIEDVFAVDSWLWFLAIENIFADDDSYWFKGSDFSFYYEVESGRIHPIEHDGNEAFAARDALLSPTAGAAGGTNSRPMLARLLAINELRQRYFAHMRTVLQEYHNPSVMTPMIDAYQALSADAIMADTNKNFSMAAYTNGVHGLKMFVTNRYNFLMTHADVSPLPPIIGAVTVRGPSPTPTQPATINANVSANGINGIDSVWLYFRDKPYGRFAVSQMFDDGAHDDEGAGDGVFGGRTANFPAGNKIHYYIEARSANVAQAAVFAPARAEQETFDYIVATPTSTNTSVLINELMASNSSTIQDPQGEYDDWIELLNVTNQEIDLTGHYLSDEPNNPRKWQFPAGTRIPANGFLLVWADEDGMAPEGLHASFRFSAAGESVFLIATDANLNAVLDSVTFGLQTTDLSYGRLNADPARLEVMQPTPGQLNN